MSTAVTHRPNAVTEADNVAYEISYQADRGTDTVIAAYTQTYDRGMVQFLNHAHKVVALVPVHIVALIRRTDPNAEHAETGRRRRPSSDDD